MDSRMIYMRTVRIYLRYESYFRACRQTLCVPNLQFANGNLHFALLLRLQLDDLPWKSYFRSDAALFIDLWL